MKTHTKDGDYINPIKRGERGAKNYIEDSESPIK